MIVFKIIIEVVCIIVAIASCSYFAFLCGYAKGKKLPCCHCGKDRFDKEENENVEDKEEAAINKMLNAVNELKAIRGIKD